MQELVSEFLDRLIALEHEMKMLQQDKKELIENYKDKLDVKAIKAALQIAKIKARLDNTSDVELNNWLDIVTKKISL